MDISQKASSIISEARQWTLAGDCSLLQWMEDISQNLENRVTVTNESFGNLEQNVKRTTITLDNTRNKLAIFQNTQFVENRIQDDEEYYSNASKIAREKDGKDGKVEVENLNTFLKNNLKMLSKCHERNSLVFRESSGDNSNNYMYQPKNPYNDRPLPHIYGSNMWKEKWHVGLTECSDEYSEDETDEFSKSCSTSQSFDSSSIANVSEGKSSDWNLNTERPPSVNLSAYREKNSLFREDIISQSGSTNESAIPSIPRRSDSFSDDPVFSTRSSPSVSSTSSLANRVSNISKAGIQHFKTSTDEISEKRAASSDQKILHEIPTETTESEKSNMRKKPVNLFDDNEFNSFMNQIVSKASAISSQVDQERDKKDKGKAKSNHKKSVNLFESPERSPKSSSSEKTFTFPKKSVTPIKSSLTDQKNLGTIPKVKNTKIPKSAPMRSDSLFDHISSHQLTPDESKAITQTKQNKDHQGKANKKPNLFESPSSSPPKSNDLFAKISDIKSPSSITRTTVKNLFDDDDGDENDLFFIPPQKKELIPHKQSVKGLFDDDMEDDADNTKKSFPAQTSEKNKKVAPTLLSKTVKALFDDDQGIAFDDRETKSPFIDDQLPVLKSEERKDTSILTRISARNLFDDDDDDDDDFLNVFGPMKTGKKDGSRKNSMSGEISATRPLDFDEVFDKKPEIDQIINDFSIESGEKDSVSESTQPNNKTSPRGKNIVAFSDPVAPDQESVLKVETVPRQEQVTSKYSNIFQDEPPDDDFQNTHEGSSKLEGAKSSNSFYDSSSDVLSNTEEIPTKKTNYSSLGLFMDDPPPDDDNDGLERSPESKRIHSIFYDDFNETREANKINKKSSTATSKITSNYIFSDEPPSDEEDNRIKQQNIKINSLSTVTISGESPLKEKPKIPKLQIPNLNIDVKALLPRTSDAIIKPKLLERTPTISETVSVASSTKKDFNSTTLPIFSDSILPNLYKNRPQIQGRRRPSTRKARLESYIKSKEATEKQTQEQNDEDETIKTDLGTVKNIQSNSSDNPITVASVTHETLSKAQPSSPLNNKSSLLFSDDPFDSDDLFVDKVKVKNFTKPTNEIFSSDRADHNDDKNNDNDNEDDDDDDEFSKLFGKFTAKSKATVKQQQTKTSNLFNDSENEDDFDVFKSKSKGAKAHESVDNKNPKRSLTNKGAVTNLDDNPLSDLLNS